MKKSNGISRDSEALGWDPQDADAQASHTFPE